MAKVCYLCEPSAGKEALGQVEIDSVFNSDGKEVYSEFFNICSREEFENRDDIILFIGDMLVLALREFKNNKNFEKIDSMILSVVDIHTKTICFSVNVKINSGVSHDNEYLKWEYDITDWSKNGYMLKVGE